MLDSRHCSAPHMLLHIYRCPPRPPPIPFLVLSIAVSLSVRDKCQCVGMCRCWSVIVRGRARAHSNKHSPSPLLADAWLFVVCSGLFVRPQVTPDPGAPPPSGAHAYLILKSHFLTRRVQRRHPPADTLSHKGACLLTLIHSPFFFSFYFFLSSDSLWEVEPPAGH